MKLYRDPDTGAVIKLNGGYMVEKPTEGGGGGPGYPTDGLIYRWEFENNLIDEENNLTLLASNTVEYTNGPNNNNAISLQGSDYVYTNNINISKTNDITISYWVNFGTVTPGFRAGINDFGDPNDAHLGLFINNSLKINVLSYDKSFITTNKTVNYDDNWHMITITYNSLTYEINFYYDNILFYTTTNQNLYDNETLKLNKVYGANGANNHKYSLVRIYKKVLTTDEINKLYMEGNG